MNPFLLALSLAFVPVPLTVPVGGTVNIGGVDYIVTLQTTIVLTPTAAPIIIPPPSLPGDPVVNGYLGPGRMPLPPSPTVLVGSTLYLEGTKFGTAIGQVQFSGMPCVVLSWSDSEIAIILPARSTSGVPSTILVTRVDGRYTMSAAITVQ